MHDQVEIRAVLFDCNGVIADDEPVHLKLFQKALKEEGIPLTVKEYFKRYLAMDDKSCFIDVLKRYKRPVSPKIIQDLIDRKAAYYEDVIKKEIRIFPGVKQLAQALSKKYAVAVVSGALRHEITWILKYAEIKNCFSVVISAEDVKNGKPHPECYKKGLKALNRLAQFRKNPLKAKECVAIEDSIHGVQSAQGAGMKCIAVTNSYSKEKLFEADLVVTSLSDLLRRPPAFLAPNFQKAQKARR